MNKGNGKTRLAIAVFDGGENLYRALTELMKRGFSRQQLGVVGLSTVLARLRRLALLAGQEGSAEAGIVDDVERAPMQFSADDIMVTRNSVWHVIGSFGPSSSDGLISAAWMVPQLRDDLTKHVRDGAVLLGVGAANLDQQRQSTRVLLEFSSHRVQTHEFTL